MGVFVAGTTPAHAQKKGKDKEAERIEKEEKRDAKNARAYEKVKTYSLDKYESDPDFRDTVDQAYADLLRDHKDLAFEKNTHRGSRIYAVNEDRFRMNDQKELYDNLLVQSRINRVGQGLVPKDSERLFAFRLTADPTPGAQTLATGTIYISTGMVSLLDNEAQLSYVLAHEMAHVQLDHWKQKVMVERGLEAYNADQTKKTERMAAGIGILGAVAGGIAKGGSGAVIGGLGGVAAGAILGSILNRHAVVNWDRAQEDEADKLAFKAMLNAKYDVREVPKLYSLMESVVVRDNRVGLGFLGERNRINERKEAAGKLINEAYKAEIEAQLKGAGFSGDSAGHRNLMAELKRDNGIMAYYSDMFSVARKNLEEAVAIRDNDPTAQYYYGKVLEVIGRTPEDRKLAEQSFVKAAQFDKRQQENFGAHLHRALMMIEDNNTQNTTQLTSELDTYVKDYVRYQIEYAKSQVLPPNINTIAEYMRLYGAAEWRPEMPSDAEVIRTSQTNLPPAPQDTVVKPAVNAAQPANAKNPCPPGMVQAANAAALATGNAAARAVSIGCIAAPAVVPKKK
jgi:Zn-dependent protease with chaperone function